MQYVIVYLGARIDWIQEQIEWCKNNNYTNDVSSYELQLEQFNTALKILSNEREADRKHEQKGKNCSMKSVGCPYISIKDKTCDGCQFYE